MGISEILNKGKDFIFNAGALTTTVNIISYTFTDSDYDDITTKIKTGSAVVSGLIFPMRTKQGSEEALLMEQGKLTTKDKILITGSVNVSGNVLIQIQNNYYTLIPDGISSWDVNGSTIYNKFFLRNAIAGSLF